MVQGANWNLPMRIKCFAGPRDTNPAQWITDYQTAQSPPEPELDMVSGVRDYAPETAQLFTPNMPVYLYFKEADLLNRRLRHVLGRLSGAHLVATVNPSHQTALWDQRSRRIYDMQETLRGFSELPENWDSYGGYAISPEAITEAKLILTAAIDLNLPEPWVAPGGDAGIGIQWDTDRAELYIDVVPKEETTYILTPKARGVVEADGILTTENLSGVLNQLAESTT